MWQACSVSSMGHRELNRAGPQTDRVFNGSPAMGEQNADSDRQERPKQGVAPQKDRVFNGSPAMDEESANEN